MATSSSAAILLLALAGVACTGSSEPAPAPAPEPVVEPKADKSGPLTAPGVVPASPKAVTGAMPAALKKGVSYTSVKLTCCTNARVNRVMDRVLELHTALIAGEGVDAAMDAVAAAARDAEKEGALEPASLAAVVAIATSAEGAKAGDLISQRQALMAIGRQVELLIPAHAGGARDLAKAKDPDTGDIWFQREGKAANPFGGRKAVFTK